MNLDKLYKEVIFYKNEKFNIITYGLYYGVALFLYFELLMLGLQVTGNNLTVKTGFYLTLMLTFGLIFFSKLLYLIYNIKRFFSAPFSVLNETGFVFFGGFLGLLIMVNFIPLQGIDKSAVLDFAFLALPVAQIFFRLGCASYGCCYGHPYSGPFAHAHKDKSSKSRRNLGDTKVHPTQFYSLLKAVFLFIAMAAIFIRFPHQGLPMVLWMILYPMMRFFIDFTRDHTSKNIPYFGGFRVSQIICVPIFLLGISGLFLWVSNDTYQYQLAGNDTFIQSLKFLPIALISGIISAVCFSYHGPELGYYCKPKPK